MRNIQKTQENYLHLIAQYENAISSDSLTINDVAAILDEIKCFWLERLEIIELEIDNLVKKETCFVLSGAIYLDVSEYEHYLFKSLGSLHFLYDPFLKLDLFFRLPSEKINHDHMIGLLRRTYSDTIKILTTYKGYFYILPLQEIAVKDIDEHLQLINTFFWRFISTVFDSEFKNNEAFCDKYETFEEIEKDINKNVLDHLIFNDFGDRELPLRERLDEHRSTFEKTSSLVNDVSESQLFVVSVFSQISQVLDILFVNLYLSTSPFIRRNVTFNYLLSIMQTFIDDKHLRKMLEKTLVFYVLYKTIDLKKLSDLPFPKYVEKIKGKHILENILLRMNENDIDIFSGGFKKVETIIQD